MPREKKSQKNPVIFWKRLIFDIDWALRKQCFLTLKTQISFSFSVHRTIVKNPMDLCAKNTAHFIYKALIHRKACRDPMFWNTDKSNGFFCESKQKMACVFIKYYSPKTYVSSNPRVLDTRQTENLGGIGTLRWRNRECNNSPFVVSYWFSWG